MIWWIGWVNGRLLYHSVCIVLVTPIPLFVLPRSVDCFVHFSILVHPLDVGWDVMMTVSLSFDSRVEICPPVDCVLVGIPIVSLGVAIGTLVGLGAVSVPVSPLGED